MVRFLRNIGMNAAKRKYSQAFTTIEMIIGMTVLVLFFSIAIPVALKLADGIKSRTVIDDLIAIQIEIDKFKLDKGSYPDTLDDIYSGTQFDPWGTPYQYLRIAGGNKNVTGKQRKYKNLNINSTYDLYSMGPDGETVSALTAAANFDDIVRGSNGRFLGDANEFQ